MGFFFWLLCSILVVALVLLLFPFSFRMEFEVGERGARAFFFFFKKKIYEAKKNWGKDVGERRDSPTLSSLKRSEGDTVKSGASGESAQQEFERVAQETPQEKVDVKSEVSEPPAVEAKIAKQDAPSTEVVAKKPAEAPKTEKKESSSVVAEVAESAPSDDEKTTDESKPKKEKRKLTDREFWTIVLTPELDGRAFRYLKNIFATSMSLFRVKFIDCFVEGIRMEYVDMGYAAALNAFLKTYPYVGAWDFRMDWCYDKELRAQGTITASINLLRIICFTLKTALYAGILFLSFWRRRARVLKTNELPELGFIRRKIIDFIVEE